MGTGKFHSGHPDNIIALTESTMRALHNGFATNFGLVGKNLRRYMATTALTATGLMAIASPAIADNWTDHVATEGSISIDTSVVNTTNITQHTDFVKVQGNGDINAGWTVNLAQPSSSSKYVLYDIKDDPTRILGTLNANGQVYIFDQNGVIFGAGSQVNVGSIITSTGFISDANIKADKFTFENVGAVAGAEIVNDGSITVADAGLAAFVAPTIKNSGKIAAKAGKVVLASGEKVTLDLYGDKLVEIAADGALADALIDNSGNIEAAGGTVVLSAQAAKNAVDSVINMDGVIDVSSVTVKGGKIVLGGGNKGVVKVAGALKADGQTGGGNVEVTGQNIHLTETSTVAASALTTGDGGNVDIIAQNGLVYGGAIEAKGGVFGGNGGYVDTSGLGWVDIYGDVDASAYNGANGTWLIDPTNLTITGAGGTNVGGTGTAGNPFTPDGDFISVLRNTVVNTALNGGTNVIVTTVGSPNQFGQDGTITVAADITSSGSGTLTLDAAGSILATGRTIAASVGNKLNVVLKAAKDVLLYGTNINTRGGNINVNAGGYVSLVDLSQLNTFGGSASITSGTLSQGGFLVGNGSAINTNGGNITVQVNGPVATVAGLPTSGGIEVRGVLNAGGGHINMKQSGILRADADSLRTSGTGTISVVQNSFIAPLGVQLGKIQTALDAISNSGTGANTVTVGAGTFNESLVADVNNLVLKGANAGKAGNDATRGAETIIDPNSPGIHITANNTTIDGLTFADATGGDGYGIWVDGATNTTIRNTVVRNTDQHGIFADGANGLTIDRNKITDTRGDGIHVVDGTGSVRITNNIVGETTSAIDGNGIHIEKTNSAVIQWNNLYNVAGDSGIMIKDSDNVTVGYYNSGTNRGTNQIHNAVNNGITVDGGTGTNIYFNLVDGAGRYGIEGADATDLDIFGNWVRNGDEKTDIGIYAHGGSDFNAVNNWVTNVIEGIRLESIGGALTNAVYGNTIRHVKLDAVHVASVENLLVEVNTISNGNKNGVYVTDSDQAKVLRNNISALTGGPLYNNNGIYVDASDTILVQKNTITGVTSDGIKVEGGDKGQIIENTVNDAARVGVYAGNATNLLIEKNTVTGSTLGIGAPYGGITADWGSNITIKGNKVSVGTQGIRLYQAGGNNLIESNTLWDLNNDGIFVTDSGTTKVLSNEITDVGGNGVLLVRSHGASIQRNIINNPRGDAGIYVLDSDRVTVGIYNSGANRATNLIRNATNNGITIKGGEDTNVYFNLVDSAGQYGIEAIDTNDLNIFGNWVRNGAEKTDIGIYAHGGQDFDGVNNWVTDVIVGFKLENMGGELNALYGNRVAGIAEDGVYTSGVSNLLIEKNRISGTGLNGIVVYDNQGSDILSNEVWDTGTNGIAVYDGNKVVILKNKVTDAGDNGIKTDNVRKVIVKENEVIDAANDGITLIGYADYTGELPDIGNEEDEGSEGGEEAQTFALFAEEGGYEGEGESYAPWKAIVKGNKVSGSGDDGIQIDGFDTIIVTDRNEVSNSGNNGLYVSGYRNGYVVVSGNEFNANDIGAQFESGLIDLTGEGNTFNGGRIGLRFAPYAFSGEGEGEEGGDYEGGDDLPAYAKIDLSLLEYYLPTSGYAPLKLVDDGVTYPNAPGTFNGTIGSQTFTGYTQADKYYVQLANEAFYYPGEPTLLNGLNSTYDDIKPFETDGIISAADLNYLEIRFHHYPDGLTTGEDLGLFWFGTSPALASFLGDQKDLFNNFSAFNGGTSGLNVRIVGLPRLPGQQGGGAPGGTPQNLNNIETFSGNPADLNEIETAAGGNEPQELAEIETQAGESSEGGDTSCWSEAMTIAGGGQAVNVVYQGTLDDSLEQAATCGTAF